VGLEPFGQLGAAHAAREHDDGTEPVRVARRAGCARHAAHRFTR